VAPWDGTDVPELIRRATLSARRAAEQGRIHLRWSGDEGTLTADDLGLLARLSVAAEHRELSLAFQPQVEARSRRIVSAEAQLRWDNEALGSVPPGVLVPLAERTGLIDELTQWAFGEALDAQVRWRRAGFEVPVSVNPSATSLTLPRLAPWILGELNERRLPASSLTVEVTGPPPSTCCGPSTCSDRCTTGGCGSPPTTSGWATRRWPPCPTFPWTS